MLSTSTGAIVLPLAEVRVSMMYMGAKYVLPSLIVREGRCALFGWNWLVDIKLEGKSLPGLDHIAVSSDCSYYYKT